MTLERIRDLLRIASLFASSERQVDICCHSRCNKSAPETTVNARNQEATSRISGKLALDGGTPRAPAIRRRSSHNWKSEAWPKVPSTSVASTRRNAMNGAIKETTPVCLHLRQ